LSFNGLLPVQVGKISGNLCHRADRCIKKVGLKRVNNRGKGYLMPILSFTKGKIFKVVSAYSRAAAS
jgi:hypothetical protein